MASDDVALAVAGKVFQGWKEISVKRSLKAISGSFSLAVTDRWGEAQLPIAILPEQECVVWIGKERLITGYIDKVAPSFDKAGRTIAVSGRDKAMDMVDCSAYHKPGSWISITLPRLAEILAKPFAVGVKVDPSAASLAAKAHPFWRIQPGESAFESLERLARLRGVLLANDGQGNVLITLAGTARAATELVQGSNILRASAEYDHKDRFSLYVVRAQDGGLEGADPEIAFAIQASAKDGAVTRYRPLVVQAEGAVTPEVCARRAAWEAKVRAAKAAKFTVEVQGWRQGDGSLWALNQKGWLRAPWLQANLELLITSVEFKKGESGTTTSLELERPDAYTPDPTLQDRKDPFRMLVEQDKAGGGK